MRARKSQEPHCLQRSGFALQVELDPSALFAIARHATEYPRAGQLTHATRRLEIAARQLAVVHAPATASATLPDRAPAMSRRRPTSRDRTATAVSISLVVVVRPSPNRRLLSLKRSLRPSARSTYEGSASAELQAEPVDTASCGRIAARRLSPSTPSNDTLSRCGTECETLPLRSTPPIAANPCQSRRCSCAMRTVSVDDMDEASSNARPIPATWWVANVPARKPRSWPPPYCRGVSCKRALRSPSLRCATSKAPTPFGP